METIDLWHIFTLYPRQDVCGLKLVAEKISRYEIRFDDELISIGIAEDCKKNGLQLAFLSSSWNWGSLVAL